MKHQSIHEMSVEEIASEIDARLKKIEGSKANRRKGGDQLFYHAGAFAYLKKVRVVYVSYQGNHVITKAEAGWYLEILRSGFIGSHHVAFQERGKAIAATDSQENFFRMAEGNRRPQFTDGSMEDGEGGVPFAAATRAFYKLVEAVSIAVPKSELGSKWNGRGVGALVPETDGFYPTGTFPEVRSARPEVQAALSVLFNEVSAALRKSGEVGRKRGNNLLVELASGKLTVEQMNAKGRRKGEL